MDFARIINGKTIECFITSVRDGLVYYGLYISGHENKKPTACMTVDYYNKLRLRELYGTIDIDSTHGRSIPCITQIIGEVIP